MNFLVDLIFEKKWQSTSCGSKESLMIDNNTISKLAKEYGSPFFIR